MMTQTIGNTVQNTISGRLSDIGQNLLHAVSFSFSDLDLSNLSNIYVLVGLVLGVIVLVYFIRHGFRNGLVSELSSIFSMIIAAACFSLIVDIIGRYNSGDYLNLFSAIISLIIVAAVYGVVRFIFSIVHIFARLPVIRIADNVLGMIGGAVEGLLFIYMVRYLLVYFHFA